MGIKRDKYDATFSNLIREAADYKCQRCGRDGRHGEWRMDCAHLFGRRNQSVRYDVDNALCLCFTCHKTIDEDHEEKRSLALKHLGETRYEWLMQRKNSIKKWLKGEKDQMRAHYAEQMKVVLMNRAEGDCSVIELVNYE